MLIPSNWKEKKQPTLEENQQIKLSLYLNYKEELTDQALAGVSTTNAGPDVETVSYDCVNSVTLRHHLVPQVLDQAPLYIPDTAAAVYRVGVPVPNIPVIYPSD